MICKTVCLEVPKDFPGVEFDNFFISVRNLIENPSQNEIWAEFSRATNLVAWRYRAFTEYCEKYKSSWATYGQNAGFEALYQRQHALFVLCACGVSAIESTCYACLALGAAVPSVRLAFEEKNRKHHADPGKLASHFEKTAPEHPQATILIASLRKLDKSGIWQDLKDFRNAQTHRTSLPWINYGTCSLGGEAPPPPRLKEFEFAQTWSHPGIARDNDYLDDLAGFISKSIQEILLAGTALARGY